MGTTEGSSSGSSSTGTSSAGSSSTGAPGTGTTGTTLSTETAEPTTGSPVCAPGPVAGGVACEDPGQAVGRFEIVAGAPESGGCTITALEDDGVEIETITLQCGAAEPLVIAVHTRSPHVTLAASPGTLVVLSHVPWEDLSATFDGWISLRDELGNLLFGGISAPQIDPQFPGPMDWSPLSVALAESDCPSDWGQSCDTRGQLLEHRVALDFAFDGEADAVFGGGSATLGQLNSFTILVSSAQTLVCWPDTCALEFFTQRIDAVFLIGFEG